MHHASLHSLHPKEAFSSFAQLLHCFVEELSKSETLHHLRGVASRSQWLSFPSSSSISLQAASLWAGLR